MFDIVADDNEIAKLAMMSLVGQGNLIENKCNNQYVLSLITYPNVETILYKINDKSKYIKCKNHFFTKFKEFGGKIDIDLV